MIDKKEFSGMKEEMDAFDVKREETIILSRKIIIVSKQMIYSIQRSDMANAEKLAAEIKKLVSELPEDNHEINLVKVAKQEYAEAMFCLGYTRDKKLPSKEELSISAEEYLLGICDFTGEMVRLAVNSVINGDTGKALEIRGMVSEIYGEILKFDFRNGELRKKSDTIKWNLNKLEDLALEIKLRGNSSGKD
ncbi:MAG: hypothetical protein ABIB71_09045 [Candidatus Woesearchaeota archaeon]